MKRRCLAASLALCLSLAPLSASEPRSPSSSSVTLSAEEAAEMEEALLGAKAALERSSAEIARLSDASTRLSILCGALALAAALEAAALVVVALK